MDENTIQALQSKGIILLGGMSEPPPDPFESVMISVYISSVYGFAGGGYYGGCIFGTNLSVEEFIPTIEDTIREQYMDRMAENN